MSYIRPASNPEGLYILGCEGDRVEFMGVDVDRLKSRYLPRVHFHYLMNRFLNFRMDFTSYRGIYLRSVSTGQFRLTCPREWGTFGITAYAVTWCYIAQRCKDIDELA